MNRGWSEMEMAILRAYVSRSAPRCGIDLILVANGPITHRGGAVSRRLRDSLCELTALCRTHPSARMLTLLTDPAIRWPRRADFERASGTLAWPPGTDHTAIDLDLFHCRPGNPLVISLFRRPDAVPHRNVFAVCYHITFPRLPAPAVDYMEWTARPYDVAYVGNDRTVACRNPCSSPRPLLLRLSC